MTVAEAIRAAADRLAATSDTARLDAELLMAHALGVSRSDMLIGKMRDAAPAEYEALIARRASREPVAHIIGEAEFYGRTFAVSPDVLIPRGDSEVLIDAAIELAPSAGRVFDLGTGSGALLITAMLELGSKEGFGLDASPPAVKIARRNADSLGLTKEMAQFLCRDWHSEGWSDDVGTFDLILCNPPYVEADADLDPDVRDYEPASALFAGEEGLDDYQAIIPQLRKLMNDDAAAIFEIGHTQAGPVSEMAEKVGFSVEMRRDLANRPRALIFRA
ncbi:peptide chain release factor N(5)-glutamine methyltransferase [Erythrobacter sp. F6033]|uniref:peptide chain release factor N(5)-glutamine methyltransferase n=1 Tax=Erythrobacter sp. F6033 TaxID=2926401 RepID=UPI001FF15DBA|nr:peptide chain release factor N(5)-glutamine methyltransferase [Erythrobacter sp. F6033]